MKATSIRWTLGMVATEFGIDRRTVATRVKAASVVPDSDGCFSTAQITRAIHGDLAGEKLRLVRAQADLAETEAQAAQGERIPIDVLTSVMEQALRAISATIKSSKLSQEEKADISTELRSIPVALGWKGFVLPPENAESLRQAATPSAKNPPQPKKSQGAKRPAKAKP